MIEKNGTQMNADERSSVLCTEKEKRNNKCFFRESRNSYKKTILFLIFFVFFPCLLRAEEYYRIISLAPSITRALYELQAQEKVVGVTKFCQAPGKTVVGDLQSVSYESVIGLKPDIVLAKEDCTRKEILEKIESLGFQVKIFPADESFEEICRQYEELGRLSGRKEKAEEAVSKARYELMEIRRDSLSAASSLRALWLVGLKPLVAAGNAGFVSDILLFSGLQNIFSDVEKPFFIAGKEEILLRQPQAVFLVSGMEENSLIESAVPGFEDLQAVKTGRVYHLSADLFCQMTPAMFVAACREVMERVKETGERRL